jgi:thioredoxin 2
MPARLVALGDRSFERFVQGTQLPVLADFWAGCCGPCKMMAPQFAATAAHLPDVRLVKIDLVKIDTEASPGAGLQHGIRSIPTLVLFRGGKEIARRSGAMAAGDIVHWAKGQLG